MQDLTKFVDMHPGGAYVLHEVAGKDATKAFFAMHRSEVLQKYGRYIIGTIESEKPKYILPGITPGALSPVPYGEPGWLRYAQVVFGLSRRYCQTRWSSTEIRR